jgi:hypothetical protein
LTQVGTGHEDPEGEPGCAELVMLRVGRRPFQRRATEAAKETDEPRLVMNRDGPCFAFEADPDKEEKQPSDGTVHALLNPDLAAAQ